MHYIDYGQHGTAPSIPAFGHNYGFEEDECGSLKPQESPNYDHTLGPAFYNVSQVSLSLLSSSLLSSSSLYYHYYKIILARE